MPTKKVAIVIPAFNEGESLLRVLGKINEFCGWANYRVYVVVDLDTDSSISYAKSSGLDPSKLTVLVQDLNGPANAIKFAIENSLEDFYIVVTADDTDDIMDVNHMAQKLIDGCALVTASRYIKGGRFEGGPLIKRVLSFTASKLLELRHGNVASDPTNGFKGFTRELYISGVLDHKSGFTYGLQMLSLALKFKLKIGVIPTRWHDRTEGASSFKVIKWLPSYTYWFGKVLILPRKRV